MAKPLVTDGLWLRFESLIPKPRPSPKGGRPPTSNRVALEGILFVLKTGIGWEDLPAQFGCCGMTCWRRLRDWQVGGVWKALHALLLAKLREADQIDFSRAVVDSSSVRAIKGGPKPAQTPRIALNPAPNTISSPRPKACRWLVRSPGPTATT